MSSIAARCALAAALFSFTSACSSDSSDGDGDGGGGDTPKIGAGCAALSPTVLVEFEIVDETLTVGIDDDAFATEARRLLDSGETRVPVFNTLVDGEACDPQWSWHPDPTDVEFADFTIELCDGVPSYIEENKAEWLSTVMSYCPWSARVTDVTNVE
jgi:hypothetical protein